MSEAFENLKKLALHPDETDPQHKIDYLAKAFDLFTQETRRLEGKLENVCSRFNDKVEELSVVSHYFNSMLSHISQGILFMDGNGIVTTFNKSAEHFLEVPQDHILFCPFWEAFEDEFLGFSVKEALLTHDVPKTVNLSLKKKGGDLHHLEIHPTFIEQAGAIPGLIILIHDVTKERQLEAIAQRADRFKELGIMAAQVAHEIRNPLGGIKGFASLLERDLQDDPEKKKLAGYIIKGAEALNHLVTQVLSYARPVEPRKTRNDYSIFLKELKQHVLVDEQLSSKIHFDLEGADTSFFGSFDPSLLKSALLNLIVNGIQEMPEGGTITLQFSHTDAMATISIIDEGAGISVENMEKIFSPFFTTKAKGNGLGLSEVYKIVQAHGGEINATSSPGKKTTFTINLPKD